MWQGWVGWDGVINAQDEQHYDILSAVQISFFGKIQGVRTLDNISTRHCPKARSHSPCCRVVKVVSRVLRRPARYCACRIRYMT